MSATTPVPLLLLLVAVFFVNSHARGRNTHHCDRPSSCGYIRNVSYPFRFRDDPDTCGHRNYELACENNRPVLYLFSGKYHVKAINYTTYTIRLVDFGVHKGNCTSLPLHSLSVDNFTTDYIKGTGKNNRPPFSWEHTDAVVLLACEKPVISPLYANVYNASGDCRIDKEVLAGSSSSDSDRKRYSYYVVSGDLRAGDVADLCRVDKIFPTTPRPGSRGINGRNHEPQNNSSLVEVHKKLEYGFLLSWESILCEDCTGLGHCSFDYGYYKVNCNMLPYTYILKIVAFHYVIPRIKIPGLFLGARTLCGFLGLFAFLIYKFRRRHLSVFDTIEGFLQSQNNLMPIRYSNSQIKKMTRGFKDKLGEGGYGSVYKGKLRRGYDAAIKVLERSKANGQEFINEVATMGRIQHVNVVRLIGFCATRSKRALVYEFMPNGSLEKYLFSQEGNISLSYKQMFEISLGVARGIEYLHRGCDMQILHFDIKPHNILLDENFYPKVSDFGLAKLYPTDDSMVSLTAARGTMGYMAPELFYKNIGRVSYKADVYSNGMLLMEMAGRRRNLNAFADHTSQIYFPSWIYDQFKEGKEIKMGEATDEEREMVRKMVITALWCIQMRPSDRPSMNKVVEMLEGNVEALGMPPKPFLTPQERCQLEISEITCISVY